MIFPYIEFRGFVEELDLNLKERKERLRLKLKLLLCLSRLITVPSSRKNTPDRL